jgi:hypothetical protein
LAAPESVGYVVGLASACGVNAEIASASARCYVEGHGACSLDGENAAGFVGCSLRGVGGQCVGVGEYPGDAWPRFALEGSAGNKYLATLGKFDH